MAYYTALLLMGGSGKRFQSDLPKQFHDLNGKKIYLHTLERLITSELFNEIILLCHSDWIEIVKDETKDYPFTRVTSGGHTRQESSYLGLQACNPKTDYVLIHDAVRPFVSLKILQDNLSAVERFKAVDTCISSADTIVYAPGEQKIETIPPRAHFLRGQTPQTFAYPLILNAHKIAKKQKNLVVTDDCSLILHMNHPVHVVSGDETNFKITTEFDLLLAEQLIKDHLKPENKYLRFR